MNRTSAKQFLLAHAEIQDAHKRLCKRLEKISDREFEENQAAIDDWNYFYCKIGDAIEDISHRIDDAKELL